MMTQSENGQFMIQGKEYAKKEERDSKRLYESMSETDKKEYKDIMNQLSEKNLPENTRNYLLNSFPTL